ncbi:MAG TPA: discoidin domain-containing protein, partial [Flavobacterium sp.]
KPVSKKVAGLSQPILDKINIDESLLHKTAGQKLDLSAETPAQTGTFTIENGWKEINFSKQYKGKYFCLEALNSQKESDPLATVSELELIGADGKIIPVLKWKIVYASSEEVTSGNYTADKIFDQQESTFWQTQSVGLKIAHPHQIVIDLGQVESIKGFRYLHRFDNKTEGMIKDYKVFIKLDPFKI